MPLGAPAFGYRVHYAAQSSSKLGGESAAVDLQLLYKVHRRVEAPAASHGYAAAHHRVSVCTVEQVRRFRIAGAVDLCARQLGDRSWRDRNQLSKGTIGWKVLDDGARNVDPAFALREINLRGVAANLYEFL